MIGKDTIQIKAYLAPDRSQRDREILFGLKQRQARGISTSEIIRAALSAYLGIEKPADADNSAVLSVLIDEIAMMRAEIQALAETESEFRRRPLRESLDKLSKGYVYFVHAKKTGLIKIGTSIQPSKRIAALKNGSPDHLRLIAIMPGGRTTEALIHERFENCRKRGEWFEATADLISYILENAETVIEAVEIMDMVGGQEAAKPDEVMRRGQTRSSVDDVTLYREAIELLGQDAQRVSASWIQRNLNVGYTRAKKLQQSLRSGIGPE